MEAGDKFRVEVTVLVSAEVNRDAVEISKLLVKEEDIPFDHNKTQQIVLPKWFIKPLLIHLKIVQDAKPGRRFPRNLSITKESFQPPLMQEETHKS